jgi:hypothetical protein
VASSILMISISHGVFTVSTTTSKNEPEFVNVNVNPY